MSKAIIAGVGAAVVAGGAYVGAVAYSGKQAEAAMSQSVENLKTVYQGMAVIEYNPVASSMFESKHQLKVMINDLPPELEEYMADGVPFDVVIKNGFLAANTTTTLAQGPLLELLKEHQNNGGTPPLQVSMNSTFSVGEQAVNNDGTLTTDSFTIKAPEGEQGQVEIGGLSMQFDVAGKAIEMSGTMAPLKLDADGNKGELSGISFYQKGVMDDLYWKATMYEQLEGNMKVANMSFNGDVKAELSGMKVDFSQQLQQDRTLINVAYGFDKADLPDPMGGNQQYQDAELALQFDLAYEALREFAIKVRDIQQNRPEELENPEAMIALFDKVTEQGIGVDITNLQISRAGGSIKGKAEADIAAFKIEEAMFDPNQFRQKVQLNGNLSMSESLLQEIPAMPPQQVEMMVAQGFVVKENGELKVNFEVKDGQLSVNGIPLPF